MEKSLAVLLLLLSCARLLALLALLLSLSSRRFGLLRVGLDGLSFLLDVRQHVADLSGPLVLLRALACGLVEDGGVSGHLPLGAVPLVGGGVHLGQRHIGERGVRLQRAAQLLVLRLQRLAVAAPGGLHNRQKSSSE